MRILLAPDKFKGTLSAAEVCQVLSRSFDSSGFSVRSCPLADGGEGTADILTSASGGHKVTVQVHDALMRPVQAHYGVSADGAKAFLELAAASGLWRVGMEERKPERATTYGTGELIAHALESGIRELIIGCGGSATNDGGIGMAAALGFRFSDVQGNLVYPIVTEISRVFRIDPPVDLSYSGISIRVISDVTNPLTGSRGATATFGPQKGADQSMIERLEACMVAWNELLRNFSGNDVNDIPGAGAGGGFTAGAIGLLGASSESGASVVMEQVGLRDKIRSSDLVVTGEGQLDTQTLDGKVVYGVSQICRSEGVPFVVVCGDNKLSDVDLKRLGANRVISLTEIAGSAAAAMADPERWLAAAGTRISADL